MLRAALFDFDGVLRHFDIGGLNIIEHRHELAEGSLLKALLDPSRLNAAVTGQISDEAWRRAACEGLAEAAARDFLDWEGTTGYIDPEVLALIRRVRSSVPVGLFTNATSRLDADLRRLGLHEEFDEIVNASVLRVAKPKRDAFELAALQFGFAKSETLFVDDREENIRMASSLGFTTHRFTSAAELEVWLKALGLT